MIEHLYSLMLSFSRILNLAVGLTVKEAVILTSCLVNVKHPLQDPTTYVYNIKLKIIKIKDF